MWPGRTDLIPRISSGAVVCFAPPGPGSRSRLTAFALQRPASRIRFEAALAFLLLLPALVAQTEPFTGFVDVRNRFVQDVGGDFDVYRSVVNLGEGPRLFDSELHRVAPGDRWLDELHFRANNWGGDPYNTAFFEARRDELYELRVRYRNVAYFNNLPTFANPLLEEGLLTSQRALDVTRRQIDLDLELLPGKRVTPYFGFYRADGFGRGITTYVSDSDQFPV